MPNVGFFPYYREEKTKAYYMKKQVPNYIKKIRLNKVQKMQKLVSDQINTNRIGEVVMAIVDCFDQNSGLYIARDQYNSPNVDFYIEIDNNNVSIGEIYNIKLISYNDGVFKGEILWIYQIN